MPKRISLIIVFCLIFLNLGTIFLPQRAVFAAKDNKNFRNNEILVKFKGQEKIAKIAIEGKSVKEAIKEYNSRPNVEFAEPNYFFTSEITAESDPYFSKQWYLDKVNVREGWKRSSGSKEVVIAILDTGVDIDHPDLADNIWLNRGEIPDDGIDNDGNIYVDDMNGWDFVAGDNNPRPDFKEWYFTKEGIDHGTIVAGVAAAVGNNSRGIAGVAFSSKIMPVRVLDSAGSGDVLTVIEGIDYAVEKGADVINLSFIGSGFSKSLFLSLERAYKAGVVVVAAIGNLGASGKNLDEEPLYPVCYYGAAGENIVMGVAAVNKEDQKVDFSNYGTKCVDVSAPGTDFWSTVAYNPGEVGFEEYYSGGWSGSSVAAPLVSGTAALIKAINPSLGVQEIRNLITANSDNIDNLNPDYRGKLGKGRLNIGRTMEAAYLTVESSPFPLKKGNILVSPLSLFKPEVKIFKEDANFVKSFFAYNEKFLGGVSITSSDVNGNGDGEIITGAGPGGGPHVRIFRQDGTPIGGFMAYTSTFKGGVNVAAGDVDGDGKSDIVVAPASFPPDNNKEPIVKIFDTKGNLKTQFVPFESGYFGGVNVSVGNLDGDKFAEMAFSKTNGGGVRIYGQYLDLKLKFSPFPDFKGETSVVLGDLDGDRVSEIITGQGKGGSPRIKIYNYKGILRNEFLAFGEDFKGGIKLGILR
jgi:subtilisin family serine protease